MSARKLRTTVWVLDENGGNVRCAEGSTAADLGPLAERITNPHVWDGDAEPESPVGPDLAPPSSPPAAPATAPAMPDPAPEPTPPPADEVVADPAAEPEEDPEPADNIPAASEVPTGTVDEVLEWVGDDPDKAKAALTVERAKSRPRTTLVAELEDVASDAT